MSLQETPETLLVIVAEAVLEKALVRDARERGAQAGPWPKCTVGAMAASVKGPGRPTAPSR